MCILEIQIGTLSMNHPSRIEIPFSKSKLTRLLLICIVFVFLGSWIFQAKTNTGNSLFNSEIFRKVVGLLSVLMGGLGIYFSSRKLFNNEPGLVIDSDGIIENSGAVSVGRIQWSDISEIRETTVRALTSKQRFIIIVVKNPMDYIARETRSVSRRLLTLNLNKSGSPIHIPTNGLKIKHEPLKDLLMNKFAEYGKNKSTLV